MRRIFKKSLGFEVEGADGGFAANCRWRPTNAWSAAWSRPIPHIKAVCTTLREVKSGLVNNWGGILWHDGKFHEARQFKDLEIEDRVGGGDGFSSGIAYGFSSSQRVNGNRNPRHFLNLSPRKRSPIH